ncbi:MAG: aminoacyl-tRNA hydrolase [Kiritimatiellae bacterium]|nr:aminoacyl-tRNA hydrolase [Kiritimatiellia bacterium]MCO5067418.1 aminoacyl-tRNA hydrolase [Kiritimatiellia bacterium]
MKVVIGLGNPGPEYARTRHNVGFDVVDHLARKMDAEFRMSSRFPAELAEGTLEGERVLLVKPQTFMNRSGEAAGPLVRKKGVSPADVFVIVDDVDLPVGRLRLRKEGSAGGHNGLKSLIEHFGTDQFPRVRIGIGRQADRDTVQHVLGRFSPDEALVMDETMRRAAEAVAAALRSGMDRAMTEFNG